MKVKNRKSRKIIAFILSISLFVTLLCCIDIDFSYASDDMVDGIAKSLIRFHVIANSDSEEDQALKLKIKDRIVLEMKTLLDDAESMNDSREIITNNMDYLEEVAREVMVEEGCKYKLETSLKLENFPLKKYGDVVLPPGEYEAFVIRIGKAEGKNWWCVLFPPLCFVDATHHVVDKESKEELKSVLTEEEYRSVIMSENGRSGEVSVKIRFKLFEWFEGKDEDLEKNKALVYHGK